MAATIPTPEEVRAIVRDELEAVKREILAALAQAAGERLLSVTEAAEEYNTSSRTIQRWIRVGNLPVSGRGRVRRVSRADLDRLTGRA
jgi:excisionase family DNA binding protein